MDESPIKRVRHYETIDDFLEANNEFKKNILNKNRERLQYLKDGYNLIKDDPKADPQKLEKLKDSIERFEKCLDFYENRSW